MIAPAMDLAKVYLIVLCGAVAAPLLFVLSRAFYKCFRPQVRRLIVLVVHSNLAFCENITWLQGMLFFLYLAVNAVVLSLDTNTSGVLMKKTAQIASANLMLLFLGGRTSPMANMVQLSLPNYYFMHGCIAIVATCEALVHSGLSLRQLKPNAYVISGSLVRFFFIYTPFATALISNANTLW